MPPVGPVRSITLGLLFLADLHGVFEVHTVSGSSNSYRKRLTRLVPVILRTFVGTMWFGIQAYWGGQATRVALGALIPGERPCDIMP